MKDIRSKQVRVITALCIGLITGVTVGYLTHWKYAPLAAWDMMALTLSALIWWDFHSKDEVETKRFAPRDDMGSSISDGFITVAAIMSLVAVVVLLTSKTAAGEHPLINITVGLGSIVISWVAVHMVYALRYAALYYGGSSAGGVDFNGQKDLTFIDFMYLSFTIGMTYQVSDNAFTTTSFRKLALGHALISYLFGVAIIATTINFLVSLSA